LLRSPYIALTTTNVDRRLIQILDRLAHGPLDEELQRRAFALHGDPGPPDVDELETAMAAFRWFLDQAAEGDIPLTAAGYLRPVDVMAAAKVVPAMHRWIGSRRCPASSSSSPPTGQPGRCTAGARGASAQMTRQQQRA
jgi:hypothetical protein